MTNTLPPDETLAFRSAQKKRSRWMALVIIAWIAGLFALTLVKGHMAVAKREAQAQHEPAEQ